VIVIEPKQTYGRLTVLKRSGSASNGDALWECLCSCGTAKVLRASALRSGSTVSCGCFHKEQVVKLVQPCGALAATKHGHASRLKKRTPTYRSWQHMIDRCCNPKSDRWKFYGAKGVRVCKKWMSFPAFLSDMGERPVNTMLGRRGDVGDYRPDNCLWQTLAEDLQTRKEKRERNRQRT
jgi:hypothetical protein